MDDMLDDLLIYSDVIQTNKEMELIDTNILIDQISNSFTNNKLEINTIHLHSVYGIKSDLNRLFHNLISNAIKFNENDKVMISISSQEKGKQIEFILSDNGIGVMEEHRQIIFEEFQRVNKKKYSGTGLGLSICKEIVANHGGNIRVEGNSKGGTNFIFQLPKYDR